MFSHHVIAVRRGTVCLVLAVAAITAPRARADRQELDLSGAWQFQKVSQLNDPPSNSWQNATVPGYLSGWQYERAWFRTVFTVPSSMAGTRIKLRFGGVKFDSKVWLNGVFVGGYLNGYEPFEFDVTAAARVGQTNELIVGVTDWTGVFSQTVDFSDLAPYENPRDHARNTLLAPIGGLNSFYGIWQPVTLLSVPPVSIAEVFIMPSVRTQQLSVRFAVRNDSASPQSVTVNQRVLDGGSPVLVLPATQFIVPAGETNPLEVSVAWTNAHLWSHLDPHLYVLETSATSAAGEDRTLTRFGFREFWCQGDRCYLNGTPINLLASSTWPPTSVLNDAAIRKVFQDLKAGNNVALRLHTQPWDKRWYEIADEEGVMIVEECAVWCDSHSYRLADPVFWNHYAQHVTAAVKRDWNHPSIIMWSLENELLHCGGANAFTNTEAQLAALGRLVKTLDPTRPITYEADLDPGGEAHIIGLHYPYEFPDHVVWPNSAWWLDQSIRRDWAPGGRWQWDRTKPLYIGEFLWVPSTSAADFTILFGDDAYAEPSYFRNLAKAHTWRMAIEAYRGYGVNGICPWTMFEDPAVRNFDLNPGTNLLYQAQKAAYHPNAVFLEEYSPRFFAGETAQRTLRIYNDRMAAGSFLLRWRAGTGSWQTRSFPLQPAEQGRETVTVEVPATPGPFTLQIELVEGTNTVFADGLSCTAMSRTTLSVPPGFALGVYDPGGSITGLLARFNVAFTMVTNLRTASYEPLKLLVVGRDALTNDAVPEVGRETIAVRWQDFMLRGGWVLVLEQTNYPAWMPYDLRLEDFDASYAFPRAGHPIVQGLTAEDLRWWAPDHRIVGKALAMPARGSFRILAGLGSEKGMEYAAALEVPVGPGGLLCAQWLVSERFDVEPLAGLLLRRLLNYGAQPVGHLTLRTAGLVSETNSAAAAKLTELGLLADNLSGRPMNFDPASYPLVVVAGSDATWQEAASQLANLASYVDRGGKLVLHRPSGAFLAAAQATLLPQLEPVNANLGLVLRRDAANAAVRLTSHDLYWIEQSGTWNRPEVLSTNVARRFYRKRFNLPSYSTLQVESMPIKTSGASGPGGWWLYSAGYVAQNITNTQAGTHLFNVRARGTPAQGVGPQMSLKIDGRTRDSVSVTSTQLAFYTLAADLTAGAHQLALSFDNDLHSPPEDRNLFLDEVRWGFDTDSTVATLTQPGVVAQVRRGSGVVILDEVLWEQEARNATKAGRYASSLLTDLGATLRLAPATRIEAETMTNVNIGVYSVSGGIVHVGSNGRIQTTVHFTTAGYYTFDLVASGRPLSNIWPQVAIQIDGLTRTNLSVNTSNLSHLTFTLPVTAGPHTLALNFLNDQYAPPEDRNVDYDRITITPETPRPGAPLIRLIEPSHGATFPADSAVMVSADAADLEGTVERLTFLEDGNLLSEQIALPYTFTWSQPPLGSHTLTAVATDSSGLSATSAPVTITVLLPPVTLVSTGSVWRYLDNGSDQGSAWRAIHFNDSAWKSGPGKLGSNDNPRTTLDIGPSSGRFITTWFRHSFVLSNAAAFADLAFRVLRDDGVVVWLNNTELFRMNMTNSGPIGYTDRALTAVDGANESVYFPTNVPATALRNGTNVLAVELHQASTTTSDAGFDLELVAQPQTPPPSPTLGLSLAGGDVVLSWPPGPGGFQIESATNLAPPVTWAPALATNRATDAQRYFRLRWP